MLAASRSACRCCTLMTTLVCVYVLQRLAPASRERQPCSTTLLVIESSSDDTLVDYENGSGDAALLEPGPIADREALLSTASLPSLPTYPATRLPDQALQLLVHPVPMLVLGVVGLAILLIACRRHCCDCQCWPPDSSIYVSLPSTEQQHLTWKQPHTVVADADWLALVASDGRTYYHNPTAQVTTWDIADVLLWTPGRRVGADVAHGSSLAGVAVAPSSHSARHSPSKVSLTVQQQPTDAARRTATSATASARTSATQLPRAPAAAPTPAAAFAPNVPAAAGCCSAPASASTAHSQLRPAASAAPAAGMPSPAASASAFHAHVTPLPARDDSQLLPAPGPLSEPSSVSGDDDDGAAPRTVSVEQQVVEELEVQARPSKPVASACLDVYDGVGAEGAATLFIDASAAEHDGGADSLPPAAIGGAASAMPMALPACSHLRTQAALARAASTTAAPSSSSTAFAITPTLPPIRSALRSAAVDAQANVPAAAGRGPSRSSASSSTALDTGRPEGNDSERRSRGESKRLVRDSTRGAAPTAQGTASGVSLRAVVATASARSPASARSSRVDSSKPSTLPANDTRSARTHARVSGLPQPNSSAGARAQGTPRRAPALGVPPSRQMQYRTPSHQIQNTMPTSMNARFQLDTCRRRMSGSASRRPHSARACKVVDTWDAGSLGKRSAAQRLSPNGKFQDVRSARTWLPLTSPLFYESDEYDEDDVFDYEQAQMPLDVGTEITAADPWSEPQCLRGCCSRNVEGQHGSAHAVHAPCFTGRSSSSEEASCTESLASARSARRLKSSAARPATQRVLSARGGAKKNAFQVWETDPRQPNYSLTA